MGLSQSSAVMSVSECDYAHLHCFMCSLFARTYVILSIDLLRFVFAFDCLHLCFNVSLQYIRLNIEMLQFIHLYIFKTNLT